MNKKVWVWIRMDSGGRTYTVKPAVYQYDPVLGSGMNQRREIDEEEWNKIKEMQETIQKTIKGWLHEKV